MIEQNIAAASQADLELATRIIAAIEGSKAAVEYREAALAFVRGALDGPSELYPAAESILSGLCDDAAGAVLEATPGLPMDRPRLAAYIGRQVAAIAAYGDRGGVVLDLDR